VLPALAQRTRTTKDAPEMPARPDYFHLKKSTRPSTFIRPMNVLRRSVRIFNKIQAPAKKLDIHSQSRLNRSAVITRVPQR
jgi:hypothetical protein